MLTVPLLPEPAPEQAPSARATTVTAARKRPSPLRGSCMCILPPVLLRPRTNAALNVLRSDTRRLGVPADRRYPRRPGTARSRLLDSGLDGRARRHDRDRPAGPGGPAACTLGDAVEHHAEEDDRHPRGEALAEVLDLREPGHDVVAQPAGADEPADDDHREDEHDALVRGEEERAAGHRQLDL